MNVLKTTSLKVPPTLPVPSHTHSLIYSNSKSSVSQQEDYSNFEQRVSGQIHKIETLKGDLGRVIEDLDVKLHSAIQQQEEEFLKGYQYFIMTKEKELRNIIARLNDKTANKSSKDEKIGQLEQLIHKMKSEAIKCEKLKNDREKEARNLKKALEYVQEDRKFLKNQALEEMDKAIKLQKRVDEQDEKIADLEKQLKQKENEDKTQQLELLKESSLLLDQNELVTKRSIAGSRNRSLSINRSRGDLAVTGEHSYFCPYTQNKKFEKFLDDMFTLKFDEDKMKNEIKSYVRVIESFYNDKIQQQRRGFEKRFKFVNKQKTAFISQMTERTELEKIFVDALTEEKRHILKRRLKSELVLQNKQRTMNTQKLIDQTIQESEEFQETLDKLVNYAKDRVKYEEFNSTDKVNLIELFVTNPSTLLYIYQSMFPSKVQKSSQSEAGDVEASKRQTDSNKYFITENLNEESSQLYGPTAENLPSVEIMTNEYSSLAQEYQTVPQKQYTSMMQQHQLSEVNSTYSGVQNEPQIYLPKLDLNLGEEKRSKSTLKSKGLFPPVYAKIAQDRNDISMGSQIKQEMQKQNFKVLNQSQLQLREDLIKKDKFVHLTDRKLKLVSLKSKTNQRSKVDFSRNEGIAPGSTNNTSQQDYLSSRRKLQAVGMKAGNKNIIESSIENQSYQ